MTPMLMDVKELNSHPSAENFTRASNTLNYLAKQIQPLINLPAQDEPSKDRQSYYILLEKRIRLGAEALEKYAQAICDRDLTEEEWCQATTDLVGSMRNSLKEVTHLPIIDRVLLDTGLENDSSALSAGYNITSLYTKITTVPYERYIEAITNLSSKTILYGPTSSKSHIDLSWFSYSMTAEKFSWFLSLLHKTMTSKSFRVMADSNSINSWLNKMKNPSGWFLYPFFLLKVRSMLKSGFLLWKKGEEETFYSMCDAAFNLYPDFYRGDYPTLMTPCFKKMIGSKYEKQIQSYMGSNPQPLAPSWTALPASVSSANAVRIYSETHNLLEEAEIYREEGRTVTMSPSFRKKGFDTGKVKALAPEVIDVVYLPMVIDSGHAKVMGSHLGIEEDLPHRLQLASSMTLFLRDIEFKHS